MQQLSLFSPEKKEIRIPEANTLDKKRIIDLTQQERQELFDIAVKRTVFLRHDITLHPIQTMLYGHSDLLFDYKRFNGDNKAIIALIRFELMTLSSFNFARQLIAWTYYISHRSMIISIVETILKPIIKSFATLTVCKGHSYFNIKAYILHFPKALKSQKNKTDYNLIEAFNIHKHTKEFMYNNSLKFSFHLADTTHFMGKCHICNFQGIVFKGYQDDIWCPECYMQHSYEGWCNGEYLNKDGVAERIYDAEGNPIQPLTMYITDNQELLYFNYWDEVRNIKGELIGKPIDFDSSKLYKLYKQTESYQQPKRYNLHLKFKRYEN